MEGINEAFVVTTPGDLQIVMRRMFDAPRERVFAAWTKAEHVVQWWDPSGVPLLVCEIDLHPAGAFRWVHRAADGGEGHAFSGVYQEIVPPEKLVFSVKMFALGPEPVGTLVLTEAGERTHFEMTIECASKADRDRLLNMRVDVGTEKTLGNLARYLGVMT